MELKEWWRRSTTTPQEDAGMLEVEGGDVLENEGSDEGVETNMKMVSIVEIEINGIEKKSVCTCCV